MQVNIAFNFAKIYDITSFDVVKGQKFQLQSDFDNGRWFADNDPVLSLNVHGPNADAEATEIGQTTILIMDDLLHIKKQVNINVVQEVFEIASTLDPAFGNPILK